ncbi:hypothetical protein B484DRAFT_454910 [Ochromonadaceae sp. CCMP2298]|nr:hypothetical protein B484DRAFT_454910 [Ochromonadaceae sp. CCMP2298]
MGMGTGVGIGVGAGVDTGTGADRSSRGVPRDSAAWDDFQTAAWGRTGTGTGPWPVGVGTVGNVGTGTGYASVPYTLYNTDTQTQDNTADTYNDTDDHSTYSTHSTYSNDTHETTGSVLHPYRAHVTSALGRMAAWPKGGGAKGGAEQRRWLDAAVPDFVLGQAQGGQVQGQMQGQEGGQIRERRERREQRGQTQGGQQGVQTQGQVSPSVQVSLAVMQESLAVVRPDLLPILHKLRDDIHSEREKNRHRLGQR